MYLNGVFNDVNTPLMTFNLLLISFICFLINIYIFGKPIKYVGIFTIFIHHFYLALFSNATCSLLIIFPVACGLLLTCVVSFILKCLIRNTLILLNTSSSEHYDCMLKCGLWCDCAVVIVTSTFFVLLVLSFLNVQSGIFQYGWIQGVLLLCIKVLFVSWLCDCVYDCNSYLHLRQNCVKVCVHF